MNLEVNPSQLGSHRSRSASVPIGHLESLLEYEPMPCSILRVAPLLFALAACQPNAESTADSSSAASESGSSPAASASSAAPPAAVTPAEASSASGPISHTLVPLPGKEAAVPTITRAVTVLMQTTAGDVTIELYPEAAPNAVERFIELVRSGFYDDTPVSRVVPGFVAQFGVNWRAPHKQWRNRPFNDDPSLFALERGTLAFAKAGPNTNTTQVFINYAENNQLASPEYNFTVFGKVVSGMDVVDRFQQVGDPSGGLDQGRLWGDGQAYLDSLKTKPTMIERAVVK
jgi:cyclophilin family peptidyl-prolyl cis-trans isomerase